MFHKPPPRLANFNYFGSYRYHIVLTAQESANLIEIESNFQLMCWILSNQAGKHGFLILAFCFMPDHLHLLLEGNEQSNLRKFVRIYKQITSYCFKQDTGTELWKPSFYDHVLREGENIIELIGYIFENQFKQGLIDNPVDYFYSGSFCFDKSRFLR